MTRPLPPHWAESKATSVRGVSAEASVTVDYGKLSKTLKNQLLKAVETGVLAAESGHVAWHYEALRYRYNWRPAHVMSTRSQAWTGIMLNLTADEFEEAQAELLLVIPEGLEWRKGYAYNSRNSKYTTYYPTEKSQQQYHWTSRWATPTDGITKGTIHANMRSQLIMDTLARIDDRPRDSVDEALSLIQSDATITYTGTL